MRRAGGIGMGEKPRGRKLGPRHINNHSVEVPDREQKSRSGLCVVLKL